MEHAAPHSLTISFSSSQHDTGVKITTVGIDGAGRSVGRSLQHTPHCSLFSATMEQDEKVAWFLQLQLAQREYCEKGKEHHWSMIKCMGWQAGGFALKPLFLQGTRFQIRFFWSLLPLSPPRSLVRTISQDRLLLRLATHRAWNKVMTQPTIFPFRLYTAA